ncbi:MAG: hypothetical protein IK103_07915 [Bacteroidales bacterium]|nr:hypothetical protein [Bacteroidales bacterium]
MKRLFTYLAALSAIMIASVSLWGQTEGEKLFREASDYVFSARKLSIVITNMDKKGNAWHNRGFFVALPDRGYMKLDGVSEFQYTPTLVSSFSEQSNEYVIQARKSTSTSISDNPFSILSKGGKGIKVSDPVAGKVKDRDCIKFSVTPEGKAYYQRADIYVTGSGASFKVLRITVVLKKDQAFVVDVTSAGEALPDKISDYQIILSDHPGCQVVDLRD